MTLYLLGGLVRLTLFGLCYPTWNVLRQTYSTSFMFSCMSVFHVTTNETRFILQTPYFPLPNFPYPKGKFWGFYENLGLFSSPTYHNTHLIYSASIDEVCYQLKYNILAVELFFLFILFFSFIFFRVFPHFIFC